MKATATSVESRTMITMRRALGSFRSFEMGALRGVRGERKDQFTDLDLYLYARQDRSEFNGFALKITYVVYGTEQEGTFPLGWYVPEKGWYFVESEYQSAEGKRLALMMRQAL